MAGIVGNAANSYVSKTVTGLSSTSFTIAGFYKRVTDRNAVQTIFNCQSSSASPVGEGARLNHISVDASDNVIGVGDWGGFATNLGAIGSAWEMFVLRGYLDGSTRRIGIGRIPIGGTSLSKADLTVYADTTNMQFRIGHANTGSTSQAAGKFAHVKTWNVALSDTEIIAEAAQGEPVKTTGLIDYLSFVGKADLTAALTPDQGSAVAWASTGTVTYDDTDNPSFDSGSAPVESGLRARLTVAPTSISTSLDVRTFTDLVAMICHLGVAPDPIGAKIFTQTGLTFQSSYDAAGNAVLLVPVPELHVASLIEGQFLKALLTGKLSGIPHMSGVIGNVVVEAAS